MAPAAPPGKPRCLVSEGVWCLKVYDIISGLIDGRGRGFPRPPEAKKFGPFFPKTYYILYVCVDAFSTANRFSDNVWRTIVVTERTNI